MALRPPVRSRHPEYPSLEAWTLVTPLLSRTERIQVGHMLLRNQFRHPVVLAKMATTLDQLSAGRLQLGIGSGSIEDEHHRIGLDWGTFAQRSARLGDTLEILRQAFAEERIDFEGTHYTVRDMPIKPGPVRRPRPPIIVGGVGEKYTLPLVARYADVWNVPTYARGELEHKSSVLRTMSVALNSSVSGSRPMSAQIDRSTVTPCRRRPRSQRLRFRRPGPDRGPTDAPLRHGCRDPRGHTSRPVGRPSPTR